MKRLYLLLASFAFIQIGFSQVRYDDGPIVSGDNFTAIGTWGRVCITYRFVNGTNDIANQDEFNAVRQAFQLWADVTHLTFTEVTGAADINISWATDDHGDGNPFDNMNGVLAHASLPPPGIFAGEVHFDDDEIWSMSSQATSTQPIDLVTVAAHEIGHALGLGHTNVPDALMTEYYTGSHRFLSLDDINGIQSIYGAPMQISGPAIICSTAVYSINPPPGTTFTLTASAFPKNKFITTSLTGNEIAITRVGTAVGTVTITATVTTGCGTITITRTVYLGPIPASIVGPFDPVEHTIMGTVCTGNQYYFEATPNDPSATYVWSLLPPPEATEPGYLFSGWNPTISFGDTAWCYTLRLDKTTECGTVTTERIICSQECIEERLNITASPVPARGELIVKVSSDRIKEFNNGPMKVELFSINGAHRVKQWQFNGQQQQLKLNLSGVNRGFYLLKVTQGKYFKTTKVIVE